MAGSVCMSHNIAHIPRTAEYSTLWVYNVVPESFQLCKSPHSVNNQKITISLFTKLNNFSTDLIPT